MTTPADLAHLQRKLSKATEHRDLLEKRIRLRRLEWSSIPDEKQRLAELDEEITEIAQRIAHLQASEAG